MKSIVIWFFFWYLDSRFIHQPKCSYDDSLIMSYDTFFLKYILAFSFFVRGGRCQNHFLILAELGYVQVIN